MIYKTLHIKLKIEQREPHNNNIKHIKSVDRSGPWNNILFDFYILWLFGSPINECIPTLMKWVVRTKLDIFFYAYVMFYLFIYRRQKKRKVQKERDI
jgi:hypothetical protein